MAGQTIVTTAKFVATEEGVQQTAAALEKLRAEAIKATGAMPTFSRATTAALAQVAREQENARKMVEAAQAAMGQKGGAKEVTLHFEQNARALQNLADEARKVTGAIDPMARKMAEVTQQQQKLNQLAEVGVVSWSDHARLSAINTERLAKFGNVANDTGDRVKLTSDQVRNLGFQLNDAATMLASGSSPFQVMATQSGQVIQALGDGPGGVRGSLRAMFDAAKSGAIAAAGALGPVGLGLIGVTAAAGAFALVMRKNVPDANETLKQHSEILARVSAQYEGVGEILEEIQRKGGIGVRIELDAKGGQLQDQLKRQFSELNRAFAGADTFLGAAKFGGANLDTLPSISKFGPAKEMVDTFRASLRDGTADVQKFNADLQQAYDTAGDNTELKKGIQAVQSLIQPLLATANALEQNKAAATGAAEAMARYRDQMDDLRALVPDLRTRAQQINDAFAKAATGPSDGDEMVARFQQQKALAADTAGAVELLNAARAEGAAIGLGEEAKAVAAVEQEYGKLRLQYEGNEKALIALDQWRAQSIDNAGRQTAFDKDQEAAKEAEAAAKRATDEALRYAEATRSRIAGIDQTVASQRMEVELLGKSEGASAALRAEFQMLAAAKQAAAAAGGVVSDAELAKIREASAEIGRLTDTLAAQTAANTAVDQFFPFEAATREAERLNGYIADTANGLSDLQRTALGLQIDQGLRDATEAAERLRTGGKKAAEDIGTAFLTNVGDVFADIFGQATRDGQSFFDSVIKGLAGLGSQLAAAGAKNLFGQLFGLPQDGKTQSAAGIGGLISQAGTVARSYSGGTSSVAVPTARPDFVAQAAGAVTGQVMTYAKRFNSGVDARLMTILETAAQRFPMRVEAVSGVRSGDPRFHGKGLAADVQIYGANGKAFNNYQHAGDFRVYERFAQQAKVAQEKLFPELGKLFRWGGYFSGGKGKYGALDSMHFDLGGAGMGGGSWDRGLTPAQRRLWAGVQSVGMGQGGSAPSGSILASTPRDFQRTLEAGTARGVERASVKLAPGFLYTNQQGQTVNHVGVTRGQQAFGAIGAGLGIFSQGYQSGNPLMGGVSGALGGFQAAQALGFAGPLGAIAGAGLGILGGILGKRAQRKAAHKEAAEKWAEIQPQYQAFDQSLSGEGKGGIREWLTGTWSQLSAFMKVGGAAWKNGTGNSTAQFASTGTKMFDRFDEMLVEFRDGFSAMIEDLSSGEGLAGAFAKGRAATKDLQKQIDGMIDDVSIAFGSDDIGIPVAGFYTESAKAWEEARNKAIAQAKAAAGEYALSLLYTAEINSDVEKTLDGFRGTAAGLQSVLEKLGWTAEKAAADIDARLTQAIADMGKTFVEGFQSQINDLKGVGYLNDVADLVKARDTSLNDAKLLGVDPSIVSEWFNLALADIVSSSEVAGEALDELKRKFPDLSDALAEAAKTVGMTTTEIRDALERASVSRYETALRERTDTEGALRTEYERTVAFVGSIKGFLDDLSLDANLSTLSNKEQFEEAQRLYRETLFKAGGGDKDAQDGLIEAAQAYLEATKSRFGDTADFGAAFDEVNSTLKGTAAKSQTALDYAKQEAGFLAEIAASTKDLPALLKAFLEADKAVGGSVSDLDKNRQWGVRPVANRKNVAEFRSAGLPEYTGNFGPDTWPQIEAWLNTLSLSQRAQAMAIMTANNAIGYASGGYTGPGGKHEVAGAVHKGEVVWSQDNVRSWGGPAQVEAMRIGRVAPIAMPSMERAMQGGREASDRGSQAEIVALRGDVAQLTGAIESLGAMLGAKLDENNRRTSEIARPLSRVASSPRR